MLAYGLAQTPLSNMSLPKIIHQKSYEKIEYLLHRHPLGFVKYVITFIILMLMPLALYLLIGDLFTNIFIGPRIFPLTVLGASAYYLSIYLFAYGHFIDFYLDIWVVTNDRIINMEQQGLLATKITELDLYRIQDVTVNVRGFFQTIFNYGDVVVKTASSNTHIIFRKVSKPNEIRQALVELAENDRKFHHNQ